MFQNYPSISLLSMTFISLLATYAHPHKVMTGFK